MKNDEASMLEDCVLYSKHHGGMCHPDAGMKLLGHAWLKPRFESGVSSVWPCDGHLVSPSYTHAQLNPQFAIMSSVFVMF